MRHGEGCHRAKQLARSDQQDKTQHKQQMVETKNDVLYADFKIGKCRRALGAAQLDGIRARPQKCRNIIFFQPLYAHEHIGKGPVEARY